MIAKVDKLDNAKLVNVPISLNNLATKVDDLYVGKLKTVLVDLSNAVNDKLAKNTKLYTLKTKVNNLDNKISDTTTLIHISQ